MRLPIVASCSISRAVVQLPLDLLVWDVGGWSTWPKLEGVSRPFQTSCIQSTVEQVSKWSILSKRVKRGCLNASVHARSGNCAWLHGWPACQGNGAQRSKQRGLALSQQQ